MPSVIADDSCLCDALVRALHTIAGSHIRMQDQNAGLLLAKLLNNVSICICIVGTHIPGKSAGLLLADVDLLYCSMWIWHCSMSIIGHPLASAIVSSGRWELQ